MFKDYYKILGIAPTATQEEIKKAYRTQSMRWHPDKNPGVDTTAQMQDINEAYNILRDSATKARYDAEYTRFNSTRFEQKKKTNYESTKETDKESEYDIKDETLKEDIKEARKAAEDYVHEFYASLKKDAKKAARGAWDEAKGFVIVGLVMSFVALMVMTCNGAPQPQGGYQYPATAKVLPAAKTNNSNHWKRQTLFNSFSIAIPVTVERQTPNSPYGRQVASRGYQFRDDVVIFNQKGLCNLDQKAQNQYCRIMFSYYNGFSGDFLKRNETETLDSEYKQMLREMVDAEIGYNGRLMGTIDYQWVRINNANAIMVSYRRTGNNFDTTKPVCCKMLIFQDNNRLVKMMLSYREKEANLWADDFEQVLRSFEWK
jgi:hypothetical protein